MPTATVSRAIYIGVRVWIFEKCFPFGLPSLQSDVDGSALLLVSAGAPQHAPLHTAGKNPKLSPDIAKARQYSKYFSSAVPEALVSALMQKTA